MSGGGREEVSTHKKKESRTTLLWPMEIDYEWGGREEVSTHKKKRAERLSCEPAGARTQDPILKRDVLYLLSY